METFDILFSFFLSKKKETSITRTRCMKSCAIFVFILAQLELLSSFVRRRIQFADYVSECTLADKQLCNTNTTGFGQHSISSSCETGSRRKKRVNKTKKKKMNCVSFHPNANDCQKKLTISPSSPPKSRYSKRLPSSADALSLSNEYDQIIFAGDAKLLSTNENPRSKCTINWHGRFWKRK